MGTAMMQQNGLHDPHVWLCRVSESWEYPHDSGNSIEAVS
jgi:hypothetical protein